MANETIYNVIYITIYNVKKIREEIRDNIFMYYDNIQLPTFCLLTFD